MKSSEDSDTISNLTIRATGPAVSQGRISLSELSRIASGFQATIERIAVAIAGGRHLGRHPKDIVDLVRLDFVAYRPGSAALELERSSELTLFEDILTDSFNSLIRGIEEIQADPNRLPRYFTPPVVNGLVTLSGGVSKRNIHAIEFIQAGSVRLVLNGDTRRTLRYVQKRSLEEEISIVGRLHMGDFDPMGLRCRVDTHLGSVSCDFDDDLRDSVFSLLDELVMASGIAELQPDGTTVRVLHLADLSGIENTKTKSLDQLAEEQGVQPIVSMDDLRGEPIEDFDVFLEAVRSAR
jgi:hypothetical protein